MDNLIESLRVQIPEPTILHKGKASIFFDILDNSHDLTEEFLYSHQPTSKDVISVYSTSDVKVGSLDASTVANEFNIIEGPAIIVARKGYAGRLFVVEDSRFIVHEDAYPIKPKAEYVNKINLWWFVGHYSMEFQSDRTSAWGIGDFPRERFKNKFLIIPTKAMQDKVAILYKRRTELINNINQFKDKLHCQVNELITSVIQ